MRMLLHWLVASLAMGIAAFIVPGVTVTVPGAIIAAVVLGAINLFIRPVLIILTLPITILTLGLFSLVINALLVLLASVLVPGFTITGFWPAFLFAIVLAIINWLFDAWSRD